jgi:uncharacterized membrane protein
VGIVTAPVTQAGIAALSTLARTAQLTARACVYFVDMEALGAGAGIPTDIIVFDIQLDPQDSLKSNQQAYSNPC